MAVGKWVLDTACRHLKELGNLQTPDNFSVAVNISPRQFSDPGFLHMTTFFIRRYSIDVSRLKLELTETSLFQDPVRARTTLNSLRDMGLKIALDDFGTGYSSLTSLKSLPIDILKLDRTMVHDVTENNNSAAIIRAAIAMAKELSLSIVAEGVETPQQQSFLVNEGCDVLQGFLFSHPIPFSA